MKILINEHKTNVALLLSLCLLFSFSLVEAAVDTQTVEDVFEVHDVIEYNKPCINNNTWCSAAAKCNYTFYNRDNSIMHNNVEAENVGQDGASIWQYNISHTETGLYKADMTCEDTGLYGSATLFYQVTGDGYNTSIGFYIILIAVSLGMIIFGISIRDPSITIFGSFGLYFVSIYILFNGIAGTKDPVTTWGIGLILLGVAMYVSTRSAYELIVD